MKYKFRAGAVKYKLGPGAMARAGKHKYSFWNSIFRAVSNFFEKIIHYNEWMKRLFITMSFAILIMWKGEVRLRFSQGKDTPSNFPFRVFYEIQFQRHFRKREILSWNALTLVCNFHCVCFSSIKKLVFTKKRIS